MSKQRKIGVLQGKLMRVCVTVEESVQRKGPTEEEKRSKSRTCEAMRRVLG